VVVVVVGAVVVGVVGSKGVEGSVTGSAGVEVVLKVVIAGWETHAMTTNRLAGAHQTGLT
jgi:hypothetical protein